MTKNKKRKLVNSSYIPAKYRVWITLNKKIQDRKKEQRKIEKEAKSFINNLDKIGTKDTKKRRELICKNYKQTNYWIKLQKEIKGFEKALRKLRNDY